MTALQSEADELFYGGAAGGGKTDLLLGLAGTQHQQGIIFRRVFPSIRGMVERSREIFNREGLEHSADSYNESLHVWRLQDERLIEFGSMQYEKDKNDYKGRPHDFIGWDELPEFTETQYRYVNTWNRTTRPGQRTRIVATGNPPTNIEGEWIIRYWGPWLDPQYPYPAASGELRWFARIEDVDVEVEDGHTFQHKSETIQPRSRTFIPARLEDKSCISRVKWGMINGGVDTLQRSSLSSDHAELPS